MSNNSNNGNPIIGTLIALVMGYLVAAWLFDDVSFNLSQTEWSSIWVYVHIIVGWLLSIVFYFIGVLSVFAVIAGIFRLWSALKR